MAGFDNGLDNGELFLATTHGLPHVGVVTIMTPGLQLNQAVGVWNYLPTFAPGRKHAVLV